MVKVKILAKGTWLAMVEYDGRSYEVNASDLQDINGDYGYITQSKLYKLWRSDNAKC